MGYIVVQIYDIVEPQFLELSNIKPLMSETLPADFVSPCTYKLCIYIYKTYVIQYVHEYSADKHTQDCHVFLHINTKLFAQYISYCLGEYRV